MSASRLIFAIRLAHRELRGGIRGLGVFLACLILGVAAVAGVGSLVAAVGAGIKSDARQLLGGDIEARFAYRQAEPAQLRFLEQSGAVSATATMRAMARTLEGDRRSLIELKAVDPVYPLYGNVVLSPTLPLASALRRDNAGFGVVAAPAVLARLGLAVGDTLRIGEVTLQVRATLQREPDAATGGFIFGPRVIISPEGLDATGLVRPGALINYHYRVRLPAGVDAADWAERARAAFPQAGWQIRTFAQASPALQRLIDRVALFLGLISLSALLVGGVGISNGVHGFIAGKTTTIATLKCLGASTRLVLAAYLLEVVGIALLGIAVALALGALAPMAAAPLLAGVLPVALRTGVYPGPLALAALFGLLTTLVFSLWPLAGIGRISAGALFRDAVDRARRRVPAWAVGATVLTGSGLAALTVAAAEDRTIAWWFVCGTIATFVLFRAVGAAIVAAAKQIPRPRRPVLRLALANLHRPGTPTPQIVLSLGIGLSVLVTVALVEANLSREIRTRLPEQAPAFFFIDIQPDQLADFEKLVDDVPGTRLEQVPMLRGRVTQLNGVPAERVEVAPEAQWALRSDRGLTYSATMPRGSRITEGAWWPPDYRGPPLVSFDAALARGMGLQVGDTISVDLLGREITARIANLRAIDWERLGINFTMVFAPGTLELAPQTHLAAVYLSATDEEPLARAITERFPNISAIPVRDALATVDRIFGTIGDAVRMTTLLTLAAGVLVLGGAIAAGHRRRVYEAVVLKVLGATRGVIARVFLIEHAALGALSALLAAAVGTIGAYILITRLFKTDWVFLPGPLSAVVAAAILATALIGFVGTWRALNAKSAPYLRSE